MKILFSSLSGHDMTQSTHYWRVLQRMGHTVFRFTVPSKNDCPAFGNFVEPGYHPRTHLESIIHQAGFIPDFFLYIEPGGLIPPGLEQASFPTVCILCDTHRNLRARLNLARFFDHVFLYHRNYLSYFDEHPQDHVHWHPYACDLELFYPRSVERDIDVGFVGKLMVDTDRRQILSKVQQRWRVNELRYFTQEEIPGIYSRSKIILNLPLADDLNFRFFEAMSCGAMLLTQRVKNGQEILFEEDKHFVAFDTEEELFEKLEFYLSHEQEREAIAKAGLEEIQRHHTLEQRLVELLKTVQEKQEKVAPIRHMSSKQVDRHYAWLYEYWNMADPLLALIGRVRRDGRPWLHLMLPLLRTLGRRFKNKL